jgi:hypothetical protein
MLHFLMFKFFYRYWELNTHIESKKIVAQRLNLLIHKAPQKISSLPIAYFFICRKLIMSMQMHWHNQYKN